MCTCLHKIFEVDILLIIDFRVNIDIVVDLVAFEGR